MSSYPILDNRPIDQWRVVELKEELKRRKLTTRGLKEDLVKRLDEALRIEREIAEKEREQQADYGTAVDHMHKVIDKGKVVAPIASESAPILDNVCIANEKADDARVEVDVNYSFGALDAILAGEVAESAHTESVAELSAAVASVETISIVSVSSECPAMPSEHGAEIVEAQGNCNSEVQPDKEDVDVVYKDVIFESSAPINQVSEANPNLGFQVRSDYISTDSVSINEKNEYKDNIIADNIKLELDVLKPEIGVEPSSSSVDPVSGESHPMDVVEPHEDKVAAEVKEEKDVVTADINKNNENVDTGDSEKLNLDRSSGYESLEEDVLDSKHFDSKPIGGGVKEESAQVKEENLVDIVGDADVKDIDVDKDHTYVLTEKRKLYGNETDGPAKRQRKWKSEGLQEAEPKVVSVAPTTPKDIPQTSSVKRNFSSMSDSVSDGSPKERIVPPSQKPPTDSLRIDQFLRPFTLKAVQELLGKTGSIMRFWMDHIKTHCYVTYSSVEEAVETRNAIYNLQWPPNGGRLLVAEFIDPQELKARLDGPSLTAAQAVAPAAPAPKPMIPVSLSPTGAVKAVSQPRQPVPRQLQQQQRPPPPPLLHSPLQPPPPPILEKADPTIVTLDVLFKKTKAIPRIYYLPLSEEQVAAKLALCGRTVRQ